MSAPSDGWPPKYGRIAAVCSILGAIGLAVVGLALLGVSQFYHPMPVFAYNLVRVGAVLVAAGTIWICARRLRHDRIGRLARWAVGLVGGPLLLNAVPVIIFAFILMEPIAGLSSTPSLVLGGALLYLAVERT